MSVPSKRPTNSNRPACSPATRWTQPGRWSSKRRTADTALGLALPTDPCTAGPCAIGLVVGGPLPGRVRSRSPPSMVAPAAGTRRAEPCGRLVAAHPKRLRRICRYQPVGVCSARGLASPAKQRSPSAAVINAAATWLRSPSRITQHGRIQGREVVEPRVVADVAGFQLHQQDGTRGARLVPAGRDAPQPLLRGVQLLAGAP
jgi:hypothetical protein